MENILAVAITFGVVQIVNVILQTLRALMVAKISCPHKNAAMAAVAFGFYTVVVFAIASTPIFITVPLTIVTNILGTYATFAIFRKMRRDELWKVEIYNPNADKLSEIYQNLVDREILVRQDLTTITAFCYTQKESQAVKDVITPTEGTRHNVTKVAQL